MKDTAPARLALFASGNGTNVQRLCEYFQDHENIRPVVLFCNRKGAFVLERAKQLDVPAVQITGKLLNDEAFMRQKLQEFQVTHIVLAGFLSLVPPFLIKAYHNKIINIHPALLPKFGGKGMYGMHVHEAVVKAGEKESGITVHLIDEHYDKGTTLFQAKCAVESTDDAEAVAARIHELEQRYFPLAIEAFLQGKSLKQHTQTL